VPSPPPLHSLSKGHIAKPVTSDHQLRQRCMHSLPTPPRVVKPFGPPRHQSELLRLRIERSEAFVGRLSLTSSPLPAPTAEYDAFGAQAFTPNRHDTNKIETSGHRLLAAEELHLRIKEFCTSRSRPMPRSPATEWVAWFRTQYRYASRCSKIEVPVIPCHTQEHVQDKRRTFPSWVDLLQWLVLILHLTLSVIFTWSSNLISWKESQEQQNDGPPLQKHSREESHESNRHSSTGKVRESIVTDSVIQLQTPLKSVDTGAEGSCDVDWHVKITIPDHSARPSLDHLSLCVVSDTHGFEAQCPNPPLADMLVHCGDFCNDLHHDAAEARLDNWLAMQPHAVKLVLRGNHGTFCLPAPRHSFSITALFSLCLKVST
jgi:hypothetical protein